MSFFSKRALTLVGKPVSVLWRFREAPDCPLQTKAEMRALFALEPSTKAAPVKRDAGSTLLAAKKSAPHHIAGSKHKPGKSNPQASPQPASRDQRTPILAKVR